MKAAVQRQELLRRLKMVYYDEDSFKEIQPSGSGLGIETRRLSIFKADDKN